MINIKLIAARLGDLVEDYVGDLLSERNGQKSIYLANGLPTRPLHPYCIIDYLPILEIGPLHTNSYFDNDDGLLTYEFDYDVSFNINIRGNSTTDAAGIAMSLRNKMLTRGLDDVPDLTTHDLKRVERIRYTSSLMETEFEEVASLTVVISLRDVEKDSTVEDITSIIIDGELINACDPETPPQNINVIVP